MDNKLAIVGSRTMKDEDLFQVAVDKWIGIYGVPIAIVTGDAKGADRLARQYAKANLIELIVKEADWSQFGKAAGPMRNQQIVDECTHMLAFPASKSAGTRDSMRKAQASGKKIIVCELSEFTELEKSLSK